MNLTDILEALFEFALNNPNNEHRLVSLGQVDDAFGARVFAETGLGVAGFEICIDNYGIKHAHDRHGNHERKTKRGQVGIQKIDFQIIGLIITCADNIRYDFRGQAQASNFRESLVFEKRLAHLYFISLEIRRATKKGKQNRLVFQTMYIKKSAAP